MTDLKDRVAAILRDDYCNDDHETYEGCYTCEEDLRKLVEDQAEKIKQLENANKSLTKGADYWESEAKRLKEKLEYYDSRLEQVKEYMAQIDDINKKE